MNTKENSLTILIGLPRSGKSTWAKQNAGDAVIISSDWIRENILGESYSYADSANAIVWTIMDAAVRIVLGQGKAVVLDGVNLTKATRSYYVSIARKLGAKITMVVLYTPIEECLRRNADPSTKKLPDEKIVAMAKTIEWPDKDEYDEYIGANLAP